MCCQIGLVKLNISHAHYKTKECESSSWELLSSHMTFIMRYLIIIRTNHIFQGGEQRNRKTELLSEKIV